MAANITIIPAANADFAEGYDWFEEQENGRGEKFEGVIQRRLKGVAANPLMHQIIQGNIRRAYVRDYQYIIFYEYVLATNTVLVYSIFHTSQDPDIWKQRVE